MEISTIALIAFCALIIILVLLAVGIEFFAPDEPALWPEEFENGQDTESLEYERQMNKQIYGDF